MEAFTKTEEYLAKWICDCLEVRPDKIVYVGETPLPAWQAYIVQAREAVKNDLDASK